jgi:hypothetical protein
LISFLLTALLIYSAFSLSFPNFRIFSPTHSAMWHFLFFPFPPNAHMVPPPILSAMLHPRVFFHCMPSVIGPISYSTLFCLFWAMGLS